jgi:hypothetical protein
MKKQKTNLYKEIEKCRQLEKKAGEVLLLTEGWPISRPPDLLSSTAFFKKRSASTAMQDTFVVVIP